MLKNNNEITLPTGNIEGIITGKKTNINPGARKEEQEDLRVENKCAEILASNGYKIEQNPKTKGTTNPDYKIEGRIFDCYNPSSDNVTRIRNRISKKVKKNQTDRIILCMDSTNVKNMQIKVILKRHPISKLKEVKIIKNEKIINIYP